MVRPGYWIQARNSVRPDNAAGLIEHVIASERSTRKVLRRRAKLAAKRWR
jgi:hypothetical protein